MCALFKTVWTREKLRRIFFEMGEWGKIGVGYKMGSTAYGIEAVLGGGGVTVHLFSTVQVFTAQLFSGVVYLYCDSGYVKQHIIYGMSWVEITYMRSEIGITHMNSYNLIWDKRSIPYSLFSPTVRLFSTHYPSSSPPVLCFGSGSCPGVCSLFAYVLSVMIDFTFPWHLRLVRIYGGYRVVYWWCWFLPSIYLSTNELYYQYNNINI